MKTILCFGDSLTWGYDASGPGRHEYADRWPSVLQDVLQGQARIIPEGLNGRTTAFDDLLGGADRNGARILPTLLDSHGPLDLVIILLGTNDMKPYISGHAIGSKQGIRRLVDMIRGHRYPMEADAPDILIIAPPALCETADPDLGAIFSGSIEQSRMIASHYSDLADQMGCGFFDAGSVAKTTPIDGVHLDASNTRAIGRGIEPVVRLMLGL